MLTELATLKAHRVVNNPAQSRKAMLLEEFMLFEKRRGHELTNEQIWHGIDIDEDAFKTTNEELEDILTSYEATRI